VVYQSCKITEVNVVLKITINIPSQIDATALASVTYAVVIRVLLIRVGYLRTVVFGACIVRVPRITETVIVCVRTFVADITQTISVGVILVRVGILRAVVVRAGTGGETRVTKAIVIRICAFVAWVTPPVTVCIFLTWVGQGDTIVKDVSDTVTVTVFKRRHIRFQ
jgi:hypothetical protein